MPVAVAKLRVYDLSKELGISNKALMELLEAKYGLTVKSHSSTLEQDTVDKLRAGAGNGSAPAAKEKPATAEKTEAPKAKASPAKAAEPVKAAEAAPAAPKPVHKPATLLASSQQPKRPTSPAATPVVEAPKAPAKPDKKAAAATAKPAAKAPEKSAAKPAPVIEPELDLEEDDPVLELLKPPTDDEPFTEIVKDLERHQKPDHGKTTFKKSPEADKNEKPVAAVVPPNKHQNHQPHGTPASSGFQGQSGQTAQQSAPSRSNTAVASAAVATKAAPETEVSEAEVIIIEAPLSIGELAQRLDKRETELIRHLFMKGVMVTVNQTMQVEDAVALAREMGFEAEQPEKKAVDYQAPELKVTQAKGKNLKPRAPVVSIMGHVDHGKTSLLDAIRESRQNIVDTEAGGITQRIGAYTVEKDGKKIVFLDTPGHAAFTAMRMRGAQATDIAILVVAADDGVMPQTIEAINHAKSASIPIIVAVNKIDKAGADPDKVLIQLSEHGLNPEKWGGDTITVEVSAIQSLGLDDLLEMINLVSELQELKADTSIAAEGVVIEARLDKGKGPVATVLVQNGTLKIGENVIMNRVGGRVRALISDSGERLQTAGPSTPVEVLGLSEVPQAGDLFHVIKNDKDFKRLLQQNQVQERDQRIARMAAPGLMNSGDKDAAQRKDFNLIVKGDMQGTIEAINASVLQLATEEISVKILHSGTGDVSEADVLLASASNALIIAFNVKEEANALKAAQDQGIDIRQYDVIYHVTEDLEKMMLGRLSPETEEQELGKAEVRQLFSFGKTTIAGCYVTEGKLLRNGQCRVYRNNKEIHKGPLNNLKRFKEDAKEVASGYECGISFDRFNDLQPGDIIHMFMLKEIERTSL